MALQVAVDGGLRDAEAAVAGLVEDRVASRIFAHDASLWGADAADEAAIRLGWTDVAADAERLIPEIESLRAELRETGVDRIVLCGMGGSSLAPAVITRWSGVDLTMIDSTHPDVVRRALSGDLSRTAVVVSSKSGGTIETRSHLAAFSDAFRVAGIEPSQRIVIVTDPGSPLDEESRAAGRRVFTADPNVGGRFSALTAFGLVPAGLAGADLRRLLADAEGVRSAVAADDAANPALRLASALGAGLPRRFVLAVREDRSASWGLGRWIEQLVAESTGKDGRGVLPIALDADAPEFERVPESVVTVELSDAPANADAGAGDATDDVSGPTGAAIAVAGGLGAQLLTWEVATAVLGRLMEIDPFNQPDVESAKVAARTALDGDASSEDADDAELRAAAGARLLAVPDDVEVADAGALVARLRDAAAGAGYLSLQAYLDPHGEEAEPLDRFRDRLAQVLGLPVALGWGPSYLHSTGQLHKGGPAAAVFLQLTATGPESLPIPGADRGFDALIEAQARGDRTVLAERGRPVFALACPDPAATVRELDAALAALGS
ncbi:glucose-6-phosphate isomerase [Leucobacter chromiiresistens]|uniref:Glucose-6-phosphate isomerase n=1 Tax=Leucobacter chromiiresistens TaxID=1079994 RepID=A0A147ENB3_9MICO|nr:glucose-6-phosphate isomerase [Leucobacter chromiiresistens]KTR85826.1 glucose-6-phosphate isomerase [Leucobacter chromiiresistens]